MYAIIKNSTQFGKTVVKIWDATRTLSKSCCFREKKNSIRIYRDTRARVCVCVFTDTIYWRSNYVISWKHPSKPICFRVIIGFRCVPNENIFLFRPANRQQHHCVHSIPCLCLPTQTRLILSSRRKTADRMAYARGLKFQSYIHLLLWWILNIAKVVYRV